jgi:phenylacetate-CoA ligase
VIRGLRAPPVFMQLLERRLKANLGLQPERLRAVVVDRLGDRLRLARRVPGHSPTLGEDTLSVLAAMPLMTRAHLSPPEPWKDPWVPSAFLRRGTSSGSSGRPLTVWRDPSSVVHEEAFLRRHLRAFGWRPGWPTLAIRAEGPQEPGGPVFDRDPTRPHTYRVAASRLDDRAVREIVGFGRREGIRLLRGYPSALLELARRIDALRLQDAVDAWPVELLHVSSESLSEAGEARLRCVFGAPVADHYGQAERALAIQSCPAGSRHLITDYGWGEIVDGRWVGTPLFGRGMVLVRYATHDDAGPLPDGSLLSNDRCGCGWPFPVVGRVAGRADDVIVTTDGRRIGRLGPAVSVVAGIEQVQIEQLEIGRLIVRVIPASTEPANAIGALDASLRSLLADPETMVDMRPGEAPVAGPSGKVRAVVSALERQLV